MLKKKFQLCIILIALFLFSACTAQTTIELVGSSNAINYNDLMKMSATAKEEGVITAVLGQNETITYKVLENKLNEIVDEISKAIEDQFNSLDNSKYSSFIKKIESNDDYSEVKMYVDKPAYEADDKSVAILTIMRYVGYYKFFSNAGNYDLVIKIINEATGEEMETKESNLEDFIFREQS